MAKASTKIPAPASDWKTDASHISVRIYGAKSHWRAGRKFTSQKTLIAKADLDDAEAKALLADPALVVVEEVAALNPAPATPAA